MIISLVRMPADGLRFQHPYQAGELDLNDRGFELREGPRVTGRVDRTGADMRVRGEIQAELVAPCDRCATEIALPLTLPFDLFYTPREAAGAKEAGEVELHERDLDFATFENDEINLDDLVLEQIELGLPSRMLCREDCKGLCPQCGADRNEETCGCESPRDPRWQALAEFSTLS
jgi:uncharacterized protein